MKTRRYCTGGLLGGFILSLGTLALQAQEDRPAPPPPPHGDHRAPGPDAPEAMRAAKIRERIRQLHAEGKHEEANQMIERVRQAHMKMMQGRMAAKGGREMAGKKEGRKERMEKSERKGPPHPVGPPPQMRIQHLKQAAEHLQAAGYKDHADKARQEIGSIEAEARRMEEMKKREDEKRKADEAKRRDMEKRRAEEKKDRPDPAAGMREEMLKLRREVEELRGQLKKAKAEAESRPERGPREEDRPR